MGSSAGKFGTKAGAVIDRQHGDFSTQKGGVFSDGVEAKEKTTVPSSLIRKTVSGSDRTTNSNSLVRDASSEVLARARSSSSVLKVRRISSAWRCKVKLRMTSTAPQMF